MSKDTKLTSVALPPKLFNDLKIETIKNKITFQKVVERAIYLYLNNGEFRKLINNQLETNYTGSV